MRLEEFKEAISSCSRSRPIVDEIRSGVSKDDGKMRSLIESMIRSNQTFVIGL